MKTIGLTGGAGFIGIYVARELVSQGFRVLVLDHSKSKSFEHEVFLADVRDRTAVFEFAAHVDGIIHLAAILGTQETVGNPMPAAETNIFGGINVLDACRQYNLPLVYAGVGNFWMRNTYSTTKTTTERLLEQYRDNLGVSAAIVRPVNAYGPGQAVAAPFGPGKVRKIVPAFVCRGLAGMPIEVYGDGSQVSSMIHVSDVARVFVATLQSLFAHNIPLRPVEVGPVQSTSVLETAELIVEQTSMLTGGTRVPILNLEMRPGELENPLIPENKVQQLRAFGETFLNANEVQVLDGILKNLGTRVTADVSSLEQIGISADSFVKFPEGLRQTVAWYQEKLGETWWIPS